MSSTGIGNYPPPYEFQMQPPSRWAWLTRAGRAKRLLWRAQASRQDVRRRGSLSKAIERLRAGDLAGRPELQDVVCKSLLYLVWSSIVDGDLSDACKWIGELHKEFPTAPEKLSLRWQLVNALLVAGDLTAFVTQSQGLMADDLLDGHLHGQAIVGVLHSAYERAGRSTCGSIVSKANKQLARLKQIKTVADLCSCPGQFDSADQAGSWAQRIQPAGLAFSKPMMADALTVAARAAEWAGQWETMLQHARKAVEVQPARVTAKYWLIRAGLYAADVGEIAGVDMASLPDEPAFRRVRLLVELKRNPSVTSAESALMVLSDHPDTLEKALTLKLMKRGLTPGIAPDAEATRKCAAVCEAIEKLAGELGWTQLFIAIRELKADGQYANALRRIEKPEVRGEKGAESLLHAARILAGAPSRVKPCERTRPLGAMESAMHRLFNRASKVPEYDDSALLQALDAARSDATVNWLPELRAVVETLRLALLVVHGGCDIREEVISSRPIATAPMWVHWLFVRVGLMAYASQDVGGFLSTLDLRQLLIAWEIEAWSKSFHGGVLLSSDVLQQIQAAISTEVNGAVDTVSPWIRAIHSCRLSDYRTLPTEPADKGLIFPELSELCGTPLNEQVRIEYKYTRARAVLASGKAAQAEGVFDELHSRLMESSALTRLFWEPVIAYWQAVTVAHVGRDKAEEMLRGLTEGTKALEARCQLALLAIQKNHLEEAAAWLQDMPLDAPPALYARMLLLERQGNRDGAVALFDDERSRAVMDRFPDSPYVVAAYRLLGVVRERQDQWDLAEKAYTQSLSQYPCDPVICSRLGRLHIRRAYNPAEERSAGLAPSHGALLPHGVTIEWCRDYVVLHRLMTAEGNDLAAIQKTVKKYLKSTARWAWQMAMVRRYIQERRHRAAYKLTRADLSESAPVNLRKTCAVLKAWNVLTEPVDPYREPTPEQVEKEATELAAKSGEAHEVDIATIAAARAELQERAMRHCVPQERLEELSRCRQELESLVTSGDNLVLQRWQNLLRFACQIGENPSQELLVSLFSGTAAIDPWPFWRLTEMWSPEPQQREQAGQMLADVITTDSFMWSAEQCTMLKMACAWAAKRDDEYLTYYEQLEADLPQTPFDPRHVWLTAGHVWFWKGDYDRLAFGDLPPCVEDLSYPEARLLVGLALARLAATDKDDLREVASKVQQCREMLSPLLEARI